MSAPSPGDVVDDWRIDRQIGEGGMGTVYAATHTIIGKHAALKVIRRRVAKEVHAGERLLQEARIVNQIQHPNIVDIFQLGQLADGRPYLVMELLLGESLGERLDRGRVPALEGIEILLQICHGLAAAHACGVVHRDLKPDNIFLTGPRVKLLDWGIAKMLGRPWDAYEVTGVGTIVGTPRYVAPEQARGQHVDERTDLYSLGCIAHELFLESPPFAADNVGDMLVAHLHEAVAPPSDVWPDIPPVLERMILGMLEKDADERMSLPSIVESLEQARVELAERACRPLVKVVTASRIGVGGTDPTLISGLAEPRRRRRWPALIAGTLALASSILVGRACALDDAPAQGATLEVAPSAAAEPAPMPELALEPELDPVTVRAEPAAARERPEVRERTPASKRATSHPRKARPKHAPAPRIDRDATIDPFADE